MRRRLLPVLLVALLALAVFLVWRGWYSNDERAIRNTLAALADDFNESASDGLGTVARAAQLGSYFSEDVVIDLGPGTATIIGRETVIGMATRLQPRTSVYRVRFDDITLTPSEGDAHGVSLTVSFSRQSSDATEESVDAREFALAVKKDGGRWLITRATAIETLR